MQRLMVFLLLAVASAVVQAETVKGRIAVVSLQAGTIQVDVKGKDPAAKPTKVVIRTDANTRYEGAAGLKELSPPDLIVNTVSRPAASRRSCSGCRPASRPT